MNDVIFHFSFDFSHFSLNVHSGYLTVIRMVACQWQSLSIQCINSQEQELTKSLYFYLRFMIQMVSNNAYTLRYPIIVYKRFVGRYLTIRNAISILSFKHSKLTSKIFTVNVRNVSPVNTVMASKWVYQALPSNLFHDNGLIKRLNFYSISKSMYSVD